MKIFYTIFAVSIPSKNLVKYFFSDIFAVSIFFYILYSSIKSLLSLFDVNISFISKIILTASLKWPLCSITDLSNLYSLKILFPLFLISSIIIWFSSFLSTVFISFSTNVANLQPNIFSNKCSSRSFKRYAAFALKSL